VDTINFNGKYTIPHSDFTDIPLSYASDFTAFMDEVTGMKVMSFKGLTSQMCKFQSTSSPPPVHFKWTGLSGVHRIIRNLPGAVHKESVRIP
jgi:hypothetical protein